MNSIPGSKPKKFITKQNFNNPSLVSTGVTSLFNPENTFANEQRQKVKILIPNKQEKNDKQLFRYKSQINFHFDSLIKAQGEFDKLKNPFLPQEEKLIRSNSNYHQGRQSKSSFQSYGKLNLLGFEAVKAKQNHGYNIINGRQQTQL